MCGCNKRKRISGMAKSYKKYLKKSASVSIQDVMAAGAGAGAALLLNGLVAKAVKNEDTRAKVGKVLPIAKAALGGYLFLNSDDRMMQFGGIGMLGVGTVETLQTSAPQYFATLSGTDIFAMIGSPDDGITLSLDPGSYEPNVYEDATMMGVEYEEIPTL